MSMRKMFALTLIAAIAVSSATLAQGGGGGGEPEVVEREVAVPVAPVAERLEVPVAPAEQRAQLAEQQRAPPMRVRRLVAARTRTLPVNAPAATQRIVGTT